MISCDCCQEFYKTYQALHEIDGLVICNNCVKKYGHTAWKIKKVIRDRIAREEKDRLEELEIMKEREEFHQEMLKKILDSEILTELSDYRYDFDVLQERCEHSYNTECSGDCDNCIIAQRNLILEEVVYG